MPDPLPLRATADDRNPHRAFAQTLSADAIWRRYFTIKGTRAA